MEGCDTGVALSRLLCWFAMRADYRLDTIRETNNVFTGNNLLIIPLATLPAAAEQILGGG